MFSDLAPGTWRAAGSRPEHLGLCHLHIVLLHFPDCPRPRLLHCWPRDDYRGGSGTWLLVPIVGELHHDGLPGGELDHIAGLAEVHHLGPSNGHPQTGQFRFTFRVRMVRLRLGLVPRQTNKHSGFCQGCKLPNFVFIFTLNLFGAEEWLGVQPALCRPGMAGQANIP